MKTKDLLAGIAVVIDDALSDSAEEEAESKEGHDRIGEIVGWFEKEWDLPFVKIGHNAGKISLVEAIGLRQLRAVGLEALGGRRGGRGEAAEYCEEHRLRTFVEGPVGPRVHIHERRSG